MTLTKCELAFAHAQKFVLDLDMLCHQLQENIMAMQEYQHRYVNVQHMALPNFPLGSEVYICVEFFRVTHLSKKLSDKMLGPFKVST